MPWLFAGRGMGDVFLLDGGEAAAYIVEAIQIGTRRASAHYPKVKISSSSGSQKATVLASSGCTP